MWAWLLCLTLSFHPGQSSLTNPRLLFIIHSQADPQHERWAWDSRAQLLRDLKAYGGRGRVLLTHEDLPTHGAWTYFALLPTLSQDYGDQVDWVVFLDENTRVKIPVLLQLLTEHDPEQETFLGHALKDRQHVVIHHYDQPDLEYPHLSAGFVMSIRLIRNVAQSMDRSQRDGTKFPTTFSIDAPYELTKFIHRKAETWDPDDEPPESLETNQNGLRLIHDARFCLDEAQGSCATYTVPVTCSKDEERLLATWKKTLFAVKTCEKYHEERLPIIQSTWADAALNLILVSEKADPAFGTSTLPGAMNTEKGHCNKTLAIIDHFRTHAEREGWEWLVIADDDTVLSVDKMIRLLLCYSSDRLVGVGQRYGFRIATGQHGYDYPTGGSGMILSRALVAKMAERQSHCRCPSPEHPDDMLLGACFTNMGVSMIHARGLHQGRPEDYHEKLLQTDDPISFHKFWQTDPIKTYDRWFREADAALKEHKFNMVNPHQDL